MNCIAFSLFGDNSKYHVGIRENAILAQQFYPGWNVFAWVGSDIAWSDVGDLKRLSVSVVKPPNGINNGKFWRLLIHDIPGVERFIVRDADSRIGKREVDAVQAWIKSGTCLHVMRDHPYHARKIEAGMFGMWIQNKRIENIESAILKWIPSGTQSDGDFLSQIVFPKYLDSCLEQDSCGLNSNWPCDGRHFVGEYIDEHGKPTEDHRQVRIDHLLK